jgi:hypothetical protein
MQISGVGGMAAVVDAITSMRADAAVRLSTAVDVAKARETADKAASKDGDKGTTTSSAAPFSSE